MVSTAVHYREAKMAELAHQLSYSPANHRAQQVEAAQDLILEIEANREYPWDFVFFRITGFLRKQQTAQGVSGKILRGDLSKLVDDLSHDLRIRVDELKEAVLTVAEVTERFKVCSKTIQRWRRRGLPAQRFVFPDGRRRVGFRESVIAHFARNEANRIERSGLFRQLTEPEKHWIIRRAGRMAARRNCCMKEISVRLGARLRRSPETIRQVIRRHDQAHPERAVFNDHAGPLGPLQRKTILESFDRGMSVDVLARRFCRTRSSIYRVVGHEKAQRLKEQVIVFVTNPLFELPDADSIILEQLPAEALRAGQASVAVTDGAADAMLAHPPRDTPAYLVEVFRQPMLARAVEMDLFRRMNYLKYKAARRQAMLDAATAGNSELAEIQMLLDRAQTLKNTIVQANLRVVVHVARKHQRAGAELLELVSDGNVWLLRAVDRFDFARGVKFSTYASLSIMKNFARRPEEQIARRDARLLTGQDELLGQIYAHDGEHFIEHLDTAAAHENLRTAVGHLSMRERFLVMAHFGLDGTHEALSLSELGERLGITKGRVRQIEARALRKLRSILEPQTQMRSLVLAQ